jgi:hypothetical protein
MVIQQQNFGIGQVQENTYGTITGIAEEISKHQF